MGLVTLALSSVVVGNVVGLIWMAFSGSDVEVGYWISVPCLLWAVVGCSESSAWVSGWSSASTGL